MYTLVIVPTYPLEIGTLVHLRSFLYSAGASWSPSQLHSHPLEDVVITPLAIRGRIAAERACTTHGVELIIEAEDPDALIQHAFVHIQCHPDALPHTDRAPAATERVPVQLPAKPKSAYAHKRQRKVRLSLRGNPCSRTVPVLKSPV